MNIIQEYTGMNVPLRRIINKNFCVRITAEGERSQLVGAGMLDQYIDLYKSPRQEHSSKHYAEKYAEKAIEQRTTSNDNKIVFYMRRGLKLEFHSK